MRLLFVFMFSALFSLLQAHGQEMSEKKADSIKKVLKQAIELNRKSVYGESIEISSACLELLKDKEKPKLLGLAYSSLAFSYGELKDKEQSIFYNYKALETYSKIQDTIGLLIVYNDIGVMYNTFNMLEESINSIDTGINLAQKYNYKTKRGFHKSMLYLYWIKANSLLKKNKYTEAIEYLQIALEHAEAGNHKTDLSVYGDIYMDLGYVYYKLNNLKESDYYFDKGFKIAKEGKYLYLIELLYNYKSKLYKEDGEFEMALNAKESYILINDSIDQKNNAEMVKTIEAKYQFKENQKEIEFLKRERQIKEEELEKSKFYNIGLILLSALLLLTIYLIIDKNNQLKKARDKATNLAKVKSEFYSEISHELRTPLYAVIELSNILLRENNNLKHTEYLESLKFSGDYLLSLINNVLELNKVESKKVKLEYIDFQLKKVLTNIIDSLQFSLKNSKNKIHFKYDESIPNVLTGDLLKITQVMVNLISNAIKFTENGNIYVEVSKKSEKDNKVTLFFKVQDEGQGISESKQQEVFESFYQENAVRNQTNKGTGLGLFIVKKIVEKLGGKIKLKSEVGVGSTFYFEIELIKNNKYLSLDYNIEDILESIKTCEFLIVDDNKINLLVTQKVLEKFNLNATVVDSGEKAIELIKTNPFDCVLMDLNMPILDGYQTSELIREFNKEIKIIALTAASVEDVEEKIAQSKINGFVLKPYFNKDLIFTISEIISSDS